MAEFDEMTPYELSLFIEAYFEIKEAETEERITLVWLGEYYHRIKKLPSLQNELKKIKGEQKQAMSDEEMFNMVKKLNAQFGGIVEKSSNENSV